jgi:hypothetical protein
VEKATGFPFHTSFPDPEINLPEEEFSNQANTDWKTAIDKQLYTFNRWVWELQKELVEVTWWTAIKMIWKALKAIPVIVAWLFKFAFYELPVSVWKQQNSVIFVFNLAVIAAVLYSTYVALCCFVLTTCRVLGYSKRFTNNVGVTMREFPWMVYNLIVFWKKPILIFGGEDNLTAKYELMNGKKVVSVFLRGMKIHTLENVDSDFRKEMAFANNPAKKIEKLDNDILRTQVLFYFNDKTSNNYTFVGQGTVVRVKDTVGKERLYVVTATHVYVCASHFSAANSHGSAGQRFVEIPEAKVKAPYAEIDDLDFCCFEIDQSKMSRASCPTYPSLVPAIACSNTVSSWVIDNDVLEAVGYGQPDGEGLGFYRSTGKATQRPTDNPYVYGHILSTKHGWSGCGLFRRATNQKLHLAGIHTGKVRSENAFILMEEMHELLCHDDFLSEFDKETPTRHNRLYDGGGRQGADAKDSRKQKAMYKAGTGSYSGFVDKQSALAGVSLRPTVDELKGIEEIAEVKEEEAKKNRPPLDLKKLFTEAFADEQNSAFQGPVEKPPTGQKAVERKPNTSTLERATSFLQNRSKSESCQKGMPSREQVQDQNPFKSLASVPENSTEPASRQKEITKSVKSSNGASQKSKKATSTQTALNKQSSQVSSNTTQANTQESGFQKVLGKQRERLLRDTTGKLDSLGDFPSLKEWAASASKSTLKELGTMLSKASTKSPPQGTPTDSSLQTTNECSEPQKETLRTKSGNASKRSSSPVLRTTFSCPVLRLGRSGLRGR